MGDGETDPGVGEVWVVVGVIVLESDLEPGLRVCVLVSVRIGLGDAVRVGVGECGLWVRELQVVE